MERVFLLQQSHSDLGFPALGKNTETVESD